METFFLPLVTLSISIQEITAWTKLTQHWKFRDQINTIERFMTKLKYIVKDKNQIPSLPKYIRKKKGNV